MAITRGAVAASQNKDVAGLMAMFHQDSATFFYDYMPPRHADLAHLRSGFAAISCSVTGDPGCEIVEITAYRLAADAA